MKKLSGFSLIELSISLLLLSTSTALLLHEQMLNQQLMSRLAYRQNAILYATSIFETMEQNKKQIAFTRYSSNSRDTKGLLNCSPQHKSLGSAADCSIGYWHCLLKSALEKCLSKNKKAEQSTNVNYLPMAELAIDTIRGTALQITQINLHWFKLSPQQQQLKLVRQW